MGESPNDAPHNPQLVTVGILLLALLVRAAWLMCFPSTPIAPVDAEGFHLLAVNVLAGRGFAIGWEAPFCPTAVRTPLYPLFVAGIYAIVGQDPVRVLPLQMLLEVLTTALVIRLGRDLGGKRIGVWAGVLYALNGTTQRYTGYLLSETLLLPLLTAALRMTTRYLRHPSAKKAACTGLLWGLALLTKPNVQFLALFVGVVAFSFQRSAFSHQQLAVSHQPSPSTIIRSPSHFSSLISHFSFLFFWLALAVVLFPWLARNRVVFGRWMLSSAFEENLARVSAVATLAEIEGVRIEPWTETWEYYYDSLVADADTTALGDTHNVQYDPCVEEQQRQTEVARAAFDIVNAHPFSYLRIHLRGVLTSLRDPGHRLWYHVLTGKEWESTGVVADIGARMGWALERSAVGDALHALWTERIARPPLLAALLWWGLSTARVTVWWMCGRGTWRLRHKPWVLLTVTCSIAYILLLPGPIAHDRFYLPAIPLVVVLIALGDPGGKIKEVFM
ncbi:MAG: glycosyltransferase family 39 protein [Anaerolineae bacterium]|nr:glycosyltransferase family 39 protein [Anaerolineae bacterium]